MVAEWQSSSSFSVIKPEQGLFFPANYVEITKTIKHLVVSLPLSRFPQYCDRLMHWGRAPAPHSTGGVSREQIDEFITLPFHGKAARIIVPHLHPPPLTVPPQRPPLILRTVQLRAARITNAGRPASSRHGRDTKRGSKGKKSVTPPVPAPATHTSSTHQIDRPPWNKCFLILDTQVSPAAPAEPESA